MFANRTVSFNETGSDRDDLSSLCDTYCESAVSGVTQRSALRNGRFSTNICLQNGNSLSKAYYSSQGDEGSGKEKIEVVPRTGLPPRAPLSKNSLKVRLIAKKDKKKKEKNFAIEGHILGRCDRYSLFFRKWKEHSWLFLKPATIVLFSSIEDMKLYQTPDLSNDKKLKLVKFAIDFDTSNKLTEKMKMKHKSFNPPVIPSCPYDKQTLTYCVYPIKTKFYKKNMPRLFCFKITRKSDYDNKVIVAFGSYDKNSIKSLHENIIKCVEKSKKAITKKSSQDKDGEASNNDSASVSSYTSASIMTGYSSKFSMRFSRVSRKGMQMHKVSNMKIDKDSE